MYSHAVGFGSAMMQFDRCMDSLVLYNSNIDSAVAASEVVASAVAGYRMWPVDSAPFVAEA
ncbi:hypothetical protein D3C73_1425350 [compost metagenome]